MARKLLSACLILGFGMMLVAGCESGGKTLAADKQCPGKCGMKAKCSANKCKCGAKASGDIFVRCEGGKTCGACSLECAKKCAAKCKGAVVVNMKCPCGMKGQKDLKKMVDGVEQHYCGPGCMNKG
jgi:hypothetical protein